MAEKHSIEVENGEKIAAVHHRADSERFIFFCHGFGSDKQGSYEERCDLGVENGLNAVRFDFRGNGESDGDFIDQDLSSRIEDLEAVVEHFEPDKYVIFGSSFGGKVAFHASTDLEPEAIICKAPVTYNDTMEKFRAVVEEKGKFEYIDGKPIDQRFIEDLETYSFSDLHESIECPVAIFHGSADTTVHPENSFRAAQKLETDVMLQKLEAERHRFSDQAEQKMRKQMFGWLEKIF